MTGPYSHTNTPLGRFVTNRTKSGQKNTKLLLLKVKKSHKNALQKKKKNTDMTFLQLL